MSGQLVAAQNVTHLGTVAVGDYQGPSINDHVNQMAAGFAHRVPLMGYVRVVFVCATRATGIKITQWLFLSYKVI